MANIIEDGRIAGPQIRMVRVARNITDFQTIIFMPKKRSKEFQELCLENKVSYVKLPLFTLSKGIKNIALYTLRFSYETFWLILEIKRQNAKIVHISGGSWQFKGLIAGCFLGLPTIWHLNDSSIDKRIMYVFKFLARFASGFIFASEKTKEYYSSVLKFKKAWTIIPSAVDEHFFLAYPMASKFRELDNSEDKLTIGTVLSINPIKNLEMLFYVASRLKKANKNFEIIVVGPVYESQKEYKKKLDELIEELDLVDDVIWAGASTDVKQWLKKFDIYVCCSRAESSPISVWEAMAAAVPVVSSDVGDVGKHIKNGINGFVVPIDDVNQMYEKISYLADDAVLRSRISKGGRITSKDNFSNEKIGSATQKFYKEILKLS